MGAALRIKTQQCFDADVPYRDAPISTQAQQCFNADVLGIAAPISTETQQCCNADEEDQATTTPGKQEADKAAASNGFASPSSATGASPLSDGASPTPALDANLPKYR